MARKIQPRSKVPKPKRGQSSEDYWRERESRQRAENIRNEAKTAERINRIFQGMQDSIQQEIEAFYQRYASKEGITLTEARGRVSRIDMEQYERLAKKYVEAAHHGDEDLAFSQEANDQMRLYNAAMRINRLEMLKARCGIRAMEGYRDTERLINENLEERAYSEYRRLAGILGNSVQFNENMVRAIVNASYQNATWSQRLWNHQASLSSQIGTQLASGILAGKSSTVLAREIQKLTGGSTYACQRLMRTELRRVQTEAAVQSMTDNGVTEYKFIVANGVNPCEECLALDGKVFPLKEMAVGVNAPPKHPLCHCCTCPAIDEEKWNRWLDGPAQAGVPWGEFEGDGNMAKDPAPSAPASGAPAFKPAKSIEEAEQFANQFISGGYKSLVNYKGVDLKYANEFNRAFNDVLSQYDPKYKLRSIQPMNMRDKRFKGSTADAAYQWGMNDLYFNKGFFKSQKEFNKHLAQYNDLMGKVLPSIDSLIESYKGQTGFAAGKQLAYAEALKASGRSNVSNADPYGTMIHELGHYLDDQIFRKEMKNRGFDLSTSHSSYSRKISGYATASTQEYVAESFLAYWKGEIDKLDPELVKIFRETRKK